MDDSWKITLESRKFKWINLGLVGITANIILITQGAKNYFFVISLILFSIMCLFEVVGVWVVEKKNVGISKNHWFLELYFYNSTIIDIILVFLSIITLGIGTLYLF